MIKMTCSLNILRRKVKSRVYIPACTFQYNLGPSNTVLKDGENEEKIHIFMTKL